MVADAGLFYPKTPERALIGIVARRLQLKLRGTDFTPCDAKDMPSRQRFSGSQRKTSGLSKRRCALRVDTSWSAGGGLTMTDVIRGNYYFSRQIDRGAQTR